MIINSIKLVNFRNHLNFEANFFKGVNYIYGNNAVGKTNLIEGIYYFSLLRSFRTTNDSNLINQNAKSAYLKGNFSFLNKNNDVEITILKRGKIIEIENKKVKTISELAKRINMIYFVPNDVNLLRGTPSCRREFVNTMIFKFNSIYGDELKKFNKYIKERNAILKEEKIDYSLLNIITDELIASSEIIYKIRKDFFKDYEVLVNDLYKSLFKKEVDIKINYETFLDVKENYQIEAKKLFEDSLKRDEEQQTTTIGLQKDDFSVFESGKNIGKFGSQGENRMMTIVLKLAIYGLYKNEKPIVLLDDILSELDQDNMDNMLTYLNSLEQVFITSTNKILKEDYHYYCLNENTEDELC